MARMRDTTRPVRSPLRIAVPAILTILSFPGTAEASGYLASRFGSDQGQPAMPNAYAVYFNPAAIGGSHGTELTLDATLAWRTASYERPASALSPSGPNARSASGYESANTGKADLSNVLALPFVGAITDFGGSKRFHLGFATYVPFGGQASWSKTGGDAVAADGPQRWHVIEGKILAIYNTLAASYTLPDQRLSFGVSLSVIAHQLETVRARNANGSDDTLTSDGQLVEGRSYVKASGMNLGAAAGIFWEPKADGSIKLGLSYTSQPGFGTTRMSGTLTQQFGGVAQKAPATDIDFLQTYPDIVRAGGVFRVAPKIDVRVDGEYVRWSTFDKQCVVAPGKSCDVQADGSGSSDVILNVPRKWQDAVGLRAGLAYFLTPALEVFGSGGFSTPAAPKSHVDASTIDGVRLVFAAGARAEIGKRFVVGGALNYLYMLPVDTKGAVGIDTYKPPSRSPSSDGKYTQQILFLNVNGTVRF